MESKKSDILLIKSGGGYYLEGSRYEGYKMLDPYKGKGILLRILREICFRVPLLPKRCWYNYTITEAPYFHIIVFDTLITSDFLKWLKHVQPQAQIYFAYMNMVGNARHIIPAKIPQGISVWTYDEADKIKYNLHFFKNNPYFRCYVKPLTQPKYDIMFVGADKGRANYLLSLEEKLNKMGLKTCFIITKDGRFSKNKPYYRNPISYDELTTIVAESRSILNVVMPNQTGVSMRDIESLLFGVKLITTNKSIKEKDFYHPNNIFELDGLNVDGLLDFLKKPVVPVDEKIKSRYSLEGFVTELTGNE